MRGGISGDDLSVAVRSYGLPADVPLAAAVPEAAPRTHWRRLHELYNNNKEDAESSGNQAGVNRNRESSTARDSSVESSEGVSTLVSLGGDVWLDTRALKQSCVAHAATQSAQTPMRDRDNSYEGDEKEEGVLATTSTGVQMNPSSSSSALVAASAVQAGLPSTGDVDVSGDEIAAQAKAKAKEAAWAARIAASDNHHSASASASAQSTIPLLVMGNSYNHGSRAGNTAQSQLQSQSLLAPPDAQSLPPQPHHTQLKLQVHSQSVPEQQSQSHCAAQPLLSSIAPRPWVGGVLAVPFTDTNGATALGASLPAALAATAAAGGAGGGGGLATGLLSLYPSAAADEGALTVTNINAPCDAAVAALAADTDASAAAAAAAAGSSTGGVATTSASADAEARGASGPALGLGAGAAGTRAGSNAAASAVRECRDALLAAVGGNPGATAAAGDRVSWLWRMADAGARGGGWGSADAEAETEAVADSAAESRAAAAIDGDGDLDSGKCDNLTQTLQAAWSECTCRDDPAPQLWPLSSRAPAHRPQCPQGRAVSSRSATASGQSTPDVTGKSLNSLHSSDGEARAASVLGVAAAQADLRKSMPCSNNNSSNSSEGDEPELALTAAVARTAARAHAALALKAAAVGGATDIPAWNLANSTVCSSYFDAALSVEVVGNSNETAAKRAETAYVKQSLAPFLKLHPKSSHAGAKVPESRYYIKRTTPEGGAFVDDSRCDFVTAAGASTFASALLAVAAAGKDNPDRLLLNWNDSVHVSALAGYDSAARRDLAESHAFLGALPSAWLRDTGPIIYSCSDIASADARAAASASSIATGSASAEAMSDTSGSVRKKRPRGSPDALRQSATAASATNTADVPVASPPCSLTPGDELYMTPPAPQCVPTRAPVSQLSSYGEDGEEEEEEDATGLKSSGRLPLSQPLPGGDRWRNIGRNNKASAGAGATALSSQQGMTMDKSSSNQADLGDDSDWCERDAGASHEDGDNGSDASDVWLSPPHVSAMPTGTAAASNTAQCEAASRHWVLLPTPTAVVALTVAPAAVVAVADADSSPGGTAGVNVRPSVPAEGCAGAVGAKAQLPAPRAPPPQSQQIGTAVSDVTHGDVGVCLLACIDAIAANDIASNSTSGATANAKLSHVGTTQLPCALATALLSPAITTTPLYRDLLLAAARAVQFHTPAARAAATAAATVSNARAVADGGLTSGEAAGLWARYSSLLNTVRPATTAESVVTGTNNNRANSAAAVAEATALASSVYNALNPLPTTALSHSSNNVSAKVSEAIVALHLAGTASSPASSNSLVGGYSSIDHDDYDEGYMKDHYNEYTDLGGDNSRGDDAGTVAIAASDCGHWVFLLSPQRGLERIGTGRASVRSGSSTAPSAHVGSGHNSESSSFISATVGGRVYASNAAAAVLAFLPGASVAFVPSSEALESFLVVTSPLAPGNCVVYDAHTLQPLPLTVTLPHNAGLSGRTEPIPAFCIGDFGLPARAVATSVLALARAGVAAASVATAAAAVAALNASLSPENISSALAGAVATLAGAGDSARRGFGAPVAVSIGDRVCEFLAARGALWARLSNSQ